ncbi:precorrin-2 C(20)-methyltransferase [Vallitalea okinawensis]|uniref:precorrin-2 C(20)-methyltransferase n=1 Tax=Vallitalea okinawensis TaxID=2078660 RepID=UPI001300BCBC|nr:precorrin-2 C(20)-methyltransferase [Vallitalea okinawensis]
MSGKLYGIGVGSGDPEEITIKAVKTIEKCDAIIVPLSMRGKRSQAYRAIESYLANQDIIEMYFPMITDKKVLFEQWDKNINELVTHLEEGKQLGFVTIGDVSIYSTFAYIMDGVKEKGFDVELISGIPSFCSIAAKRGKSLCEWDEPLLIYPSNYQTDKIEYYLKEFDNVVLMKAAKAFDQIVDQLEEQQLLDQAYMITKCGYEEEEICKDLISKKGTKINYLSTIIVNKKRG